MTVNREIHLASRPQGWPTADNFRLVETEVPTPGPGQLVVRNQLMSVDPYMRGRMDDVKSYVPPFALDAPLDGGALGEVVAGEADGIAPGDTVLHGLGWREYALVDARGARRVDPDLAPVSAYLGVLGMTGLTAYAGLLDVAAMKPGETVFVSGAAGAVGSMVGQIAKLKGAGRVVGSAGSAAKVERLRVLGFDAAFDYHDGPVRDSLRAAAPDGIDVYFDNVGGEHLEAAIGAMRLHGRAAICGMIAQYNDTEPPAARATWRWSSASGSRCAASWSATTATCATGSSRRSPAGCARGSSRTTRRSSTASPAPRRPSSASSAARTSARCSSGCRPPFRRCR